MSHRSALKLEGTSEAHGAADTSATVGFAGSFLGLGETSKAHGAADTSATAASVEPFAVGFITTGDLLHQEGNNNG